MVLAPGQSQQFALQPNNPEELGGESGGWPEAWVLGQDPARPAVPSSTRQPLETQEPTAHAEILLSKPITTDPLGLPHLHQPPAWNAFLSS